LEAFVETYRSNTKSCDCLTKDRDALLAFYDFPAEHWKHLRTTNPIERPLQPSGTAPSGQKLPVEQDGACHGLQTCRKARRKIGATIDGHNQLPKTDPGCEVTDGIEVIGNSAYSSPSRR